MLTIFMIKCAKIQYCFDFQTQDLNLKSSCCYQLHNAFRNGMVKKVFIVSSILLSTRKHILINNISYANRYLILFSMTV